jgi:hypothetical protein
MESKRTKFAIHGSDRSRFEGLSFPPLLVIAVFGRSIPITTSLTHGARDTTYNGMKILVCKGGRTDHYSRFSYVGLFLAKNTLLTIFKRSELAENSSSNPTAVSSQGLRNLWYKPKRRRIWKCCISGYLSNQNANEQMCANPTRTSTMTLPNHLTHNQLSLLAHCCVYASSTG